MPKFRRTRKVQPTTPHLTIAPESHAGQAGYSIFEDGRRAAWGRTPEAAKAAYRMARCA